MVHVHFSFQEKAEPLIFSLKVLFNIHIVLSWKQILTCNEQRESQCWSYFCETGWWIVISIAGLYIAARNGPLDREILRECGNLACAISLAYTHAQIQLSLCETLLRAFKLFAETNINTERKINNTLEFNLKQCGGGGVLLWVNLYFFLRIIVNVWETASLINAPGKWLKLVSRVDCCFQSSML